MEGKLKSNKACFGEANKHANKNLIQTLKSDTIKKAVYSAKGHLEGCSHLRGETGVSCTSDNPHLACQARHCTQVILHPALAAAC